MDAFDKSIEELKKVVAGAEAARNVRQEEAERLLAALAKSTKSR